MSPPGRRKFRPVLRFLQALLVTGLVLLLLVPWLGGRFVGGVLVGVLLAVAALVGGFRWMQKTASQRVAEGLRPPDLPKGGPERWDHVLVARDLEGGAYDFAAARGRQVLVLNFWATWCPPCVAELPSLERLAARTSADPVRVLCISSEPAEKVRSFVASRGFKLPFLVMDTEPPELFASRSIPATFVIDQQGHIVMRHMGAARWDAEATVAFVQKVARQG